MPPGSDVTARRHPARRRSPLRGSHGGRGSPPTSNPGGENSNWRAKFHLCRNFPPPSMPIPRGSEATARRQPACRRSPLCGKSRRTWKSALQPPWRGEINSTFAEAFLPTCPCRPEVKRPPAGSPRVGDLRFAEVTADVEVRPPASWRGRKTFHHAGGKKNSTFAETVLWTCTTDMPPGGGVTACRHPARRRSPLRGSHGGRGSPPSTTRNGGGKFHPGGQSSTFAETSLPACPCRPEVT